MSVKKPDLWMPLYIAKYLADTTRLTTEQHGAYLLLIMDYWVSGPPPDVDTTLTQITKLTPAKWRAARPSLVGKFQVRDGHWHHKRIEHELEKAREMQSALSERGKAGAAARWGPDDASGNPSSSASASSTSNAQAVPSTVLANAPRPLPRPLQTQGPGPSPSPLPKPKSESRKRSAPAKTRLPPGFSISERVRKWADDKGFSHLDQHLELFLSKAKARGYTYADWDEGFMGAVRDDWAGLRNGRARPGDQGAAFDEAERRIFGADQEKDVTE